MPNASTPPRLQTVESDTSVLPVLRYAFEQREKHRGVTPPQVEVHFPKDRVNYDLEEIITKTHEELMGVGITETMILEAIGKDQKYLEIVLPQKIEGVQQALDLYYQYVDNILTKTSQKIENAKGGGTAASADIGAALLAKGTTSFLDTLKLTMDDELFQEANNVIGFSSELVLLAMVNKYQLSFTKHQLCFAVVQSVDFLVANPISRDGILAYAEQMVEKVPSVREQFIDAEYGILAEVIALEMMAYSNLAEEHDLFIAKSPATLDITGIDASVVGNTGLISRTGAPVLTPLVFVDIKKEFQPKASGVCVVIPDKTFPKGYRIERAGILADELVGIYDIDENILRLSCIREETPFLVIRMPGELIEPGKVAALKKAGTYETVYNDFQAQIEGEIRSALT